MSVIEGIGDEVLFCFAFTILIGLVLIAWNSTRVRPIFNPSSVWMVHMQTSPERRVLEVYSVDDSSDDVRSRLDAAGPHVIDDRSIARSSTDDVDAATVSSDGDTVAIDESGTSECQDQTPDEQSQCSTTATDTNHCSESNNVQQVVDPAVSNSQKSSSGSNTATIKLKFLDDTQKLVAAWLSQTVGEFKRQHFETDVSEGKVIRLIYRGQLLRDDSRSLASYGLHENCVVHCHVSTTPYGHQRNQGSHQRSSYETASSQVGGGGMAATFNHHNVGGNVLDLGRYVHLIFAFKFAALWAAWFVFPEYFNRTSLVSLILCSGLFMLFWFGSQRRRLAAGDVGGGSGNEFASS